VSGSYRGMSGSKEEEGALLGGGARAFALGCAGRGGGRVVAPVGGKGGRTEAGAGRGVAPVGGTGGRVGASAWGRGAADTLCDRSRRDALMGESLQSRAALVGRVATIACMVPNWVVMVSS